jgi:hypothetical protein
MRDLLLFWRHRFNSHKRISKAPGIKICDRECLSLLGSPIFDQGFKNTVEKTIITVENLLNKAELLNRHVAYTLIKNCLFIPKFNFLLRTTPFWKFVTIFFFIVWFLQHCHYFFFYRLVFATSRNPWLAMDLSFFNLLF